MPARSPMIVSIVCVGLVAASFVLPGAHSNRDDGWTIAGFKDERAAFQLGVPQERPVIVAPATASSSVMDFVPDLQTMKAALQGFGFSVAGLVDAANAQAGGQFGARRTSEAEVRLSPLAEPRFSRVVMDPVNGATFDGTGPAGADIVLWRQGRALGRAKVEPNGKWSVQIDEPFSTGDHSVTLGVDLNRGRPQVFGQEVRISIPRNFRDGGAVTIDVPAPRVEERAEPRSLEPGSSAYAEALRRRAEELAAAASRRFDQIAPSSEPVIIDPDLQTKRVARQTGQAGQPDDTVPERTNGNIPMPERRSDREIEIAGKSSGSDGARDGNGDSVLAPVIDWLERSARDYQNVIVPGLSDPAKQPDDLRAGRTPEPPNGKPSERVRRDVDDARRARLEEQELLDREAAELRRRRADELRARDAQAEAIARTDAEREAAERAEAERIRQRSLVTAEDAARKQAESFERDQSGTLAAQDALEEQRRLDAEAEALRVRRQEDVVRLSEEQRRRALDAQVARLEAERARKLAEREQARRDALEARDREAQEQRRAQEERQRQALIEERERARVDALQIAAEQRRDAIINAKLRRAREVARLDDAYRISLEAAASRVEPEEPVPSSPQSVDVVVLLPERRPSLPAVSVERDGFAWEDRSASRVAVSPPLPDRDEMKRPIRIDVSRLVVPEENTQRRLAVRTVYEQGSAVRGPVDDDDRNDGRYAENRHSVREPRVRYRAVNKGRSNSCQGRAGKKVRLGGTYIVAPGDTLWAISRRHYKLGRRYPIIFRANRKKIKDPDLIYPCQRLYLPKR